MSNFTIQEFWKPRLAVDHVTAMSPVRGWIIEKEGLTTFKEAPLSLNAELSSSKDPAHCQIILVSAPGAVGKSTLARQIAFVTGSVYLDLAKSDPVGANTLSGGLVKASLYSEWKAQKTSVLIDGLDEARLRVTQEAFEAFLADVVELAKGRTVPTVLFGRTGAIQEAWLALTAADVDIAVLEIGYYSPEASVDFAEARLRVNRPDMTHATAERKAIELLLARLRAQTESDGDRFAGYAPVLQAVAERVAGESNPSALIAQIEKGSKPITLQAVSSAILERERSKLSGLSFEDKDLKEKLYSPDEQLDRLAARLFNLQPPDIPMMGTKDVQTYSAALETWVAEHPFLNGNKEASSAVFDAVICTRALKQAKSSGVAVQRELRRGAAANPFLAEFYLPESIDPEQTFLPPEHVGIVYASLRARLSLGDTASLLVEGPEDAEEEEVLRAEIEITLARHGVDRPRVLHFSTEQTGVLRLGAYVEDVEIIAPHATVEIGSGPECVLVAPVIVQCQRLVVTAERIIAESPPAQKGGAIFLEASDFEGVQMGSVPIVRGNVSLAASWNGVRSHPWTNFATSASKIEDPRVEETLRRFRKFVIAFRSHSKGNLARFQDKIEHARMTKGTGQAILDLMVADDILSLQGSMYYLDPDRLGAQTGATYADCMARQFRHETIAFVERALSASK
jgi:hypothetical protein